MSTYENQISALEGAIKNAYINYDKSLPTYGQKAENLAQRGITNSGYSDYLNGVAYSSMVSNVQANEAVKRAYEKENQANASTYTYTPPDTSTDTGVDEGTRHAYNSAVEEAIKNIQEKGWSAEGALAALYEAYGDYPELITPETKELIYNAYKDVGIDYLTKVTTNGYVDEAGNTVWLSAEKIAELEKTYGLSAEEIKTYDFTNASQNAEKETYNEKVKAFEAGLKGIKEEGKEAPTFYTDEEIESFCKAMGITDNNKIDGYKTDRDAAYDDYIYDSIKENIDANMTDEMIEDFVSEYGHSDNVAEKIKGRRNSLLELQFIDTYSKPSDSAKTDSLKDVEEARSKGKISKDTYERCYFYNACNLIELVPSGARTKKEVLGDLERWKKGGQLNDADYNSLIEYLENVTKMGTSTEKVKSKAGFGNILAAVHMGTSLPAIIGGAISGDHLWNNRRNVYINDKKYTVDVVDDYTPSEEEKAMFDSIASDGGNIIRVGDEYYVKHSRTGEWAKVKKKGTDEAFFETINSKLRTPVNIKRPEHQKTDKGG